MRRPYRMNPTEPDQKPIQQTSEFSQNSEVLGFWRGHHSGQAGGGDGSGGDDGLYGATPPSSALRRPYR